jgi:hypothetical protein
VNVDVSKDGGVKILRVREKQEREAIEEMRAERRRRPDGLLAVREADRERGRKAVHEGKVKFRKWVEHQGGVPDIGMPAQAGDYGDMKSMLTNDDRRSNPLLPLDHPHQRPEALYNPNVHLLPAPLCFIRISIRLQR